jgi:outer membrane protein OmpA-like peptidoglycan-associated protein
MKKAVVILYSLCLVYCASKPKEEPKKASAPTVSMESKQIAAEQQAKESAEIHFAKGSSQLSAQAKEQLNKLIKSAQESGGLKKVEVIAWADSEYPSVNTKSLSKSEVHLASQRGLEIKSYIALHSKQARIDTYNMAQRPSYLESFVKSREAQIKKSLETSGIPTTDTAVKTPSQASKAIVLVGIE